MKASLQRGGKRSPGLAAFGEKSPATAAEVLQRCAGGPCKKAIFTVKFWPAGTFPVTESIGGYRRERDAHPNGRRITARAMSGTELSRVRTDHRLRPPEPTI